MAKIIKTESGIDLLQRLSVRPKLSGFQTTVFGESGPHPGDVIEISEKNTDLKNVLLTQWVTECILPKVWKGINIGGFEVGIVYLSTDHHFSSLHLVTLLEKRLKRTLRQFRDLVAGSGAATVKEITKESLKRLSVYESFSKNELLFNFCSVKTYVLSHSQSSVVIIDSISAYYWEDRLTAPIQSLDKYCQSLLSNLIEKLKQTNIVIIYTIQRFLREVQQEKDTQTDPPLYIYSLSLENHPECIMHVEDRRCARHFSKPIKISKGELNFE